MSTPTIGELAWQLRSNTLYVDEGIVKLFPPMVGSATAETRAIIQARADAINKTLSENGLQFATIEQVKKYFNRLENG